MTTVAVAESAYPTPTQVRDVLLRTVRFAYAKRGLSANVLPGSDHFYRAQAYARRISIAIANNGIALNDLSPLTATGDALTKLAAVFGVKRRDASSSAGALTIHSSGVVVIPAGFQATAPNGHKYKTIALTTLATGEDVEVLALEAGSSTNAGAGTKFTWDSAEIGALDPVAVVEVDGLTGGEEADNDDRLRERLILRLAFPPVGGNWSNVVSWAEEASASVEAAFAYPAARGPASYDVTVTKRGGDRVVAGPILANIRAFINSSMPGQNSLNLTSVVPQEVDVIIAATLPLPQSTGGGWRDGAPWPAELARVTAYNTTTLTAIVNSVASPAVGNNIGVWNPDATDARGNSAPKMIERVITVVGGSTGAWTIKVQGGFGFDPTGAYISAGAVHLAEYADELFAQFQLLGPGEKTDSPEILPLGARQPTTDIQSPSAISSLILANVSSKHSEVQNLDYSARYLTGTTTPIVSPSLPSAVADPPRIISLRYLAVRKA